MAKKNVAFSEVNDVSQPHFPTTVLCYLSDKQEGSRQKRRGGGAGGEIGAAAGGGATGGGATGGGATEEEQQEEMVCGWRLLISFLTTQT